ncbi:MAG: cytochrome b/b6 domain-containing protein [Acidobacteriia bacterium]|nr:cytochrome b/b6 domain-containing protein [Terriglobia bacterium]
MKVESLRLETDSAIRPLAIGPLSAAPPPARTKAAASRSLAEVATPPRQILRFRKSERVLHWSIAVPFMVCYTTALILMFGYNLHSESVSRDVFSWIHRISGACLIFFPIQSVLRNLRDHRIHLYNIRQGWTWAIDDLKWLLLMGPAAVIRKITLPEQGKFNAAEKLNFMMVMCTCPLFIMTGLLLCMPGPAFLSWIVHVGLALVATPLMLGHIYMALVNPGTRVGLGGMFSGYVDRQWAKHHYRRWYREHFEDQEENPREHEKVRQALQRPALIRCSHCNNEHVVATRINLLEITCECQSHRCPNCGETADMAAVIVDPGEGDSILFSLERAGISYFTVEKYLERIGIRGHDTCLEGSVAGREA